MKRVIAVILLVTACGAAYLWRGKIIPSLAGSEETVPTAPVRKGDLDISMKTRGDVRARKSVTLYAPTSVTEVKLVSVTKSGTIVKAGDSVIVIDATQEQAKVKEQESNVIQADKEGDKVKAQHRAVNEQDNLDQAQARYDMEGAKLETKRTEILSAIDGAKARLVLETDERHVQELQNDQGARKDSQGADLNVVGRKRKKAEKDRDFAKDNINLLTLKAPTDGMIVLMQNWRAGNNMGQAPEFKAGDQAWPGAILAELPDLKTLYVELAIEETDRGKVAVGQPVNLKIDAIPDRDFSGKIESITTTAQLVFEFWPPKKNFMAAVSISQDDARLRPNMSAHADVATQKLSGVILIPSRAAFERNGRTIAWVRHGDRFEAREIILGQKNKGQSQVVSGLAPGDIVALESPTKDEGAKGGSK